MVVSDGASGIGDGVVAIVATRPCAAIAEHVSRTGGVATEAVGISGGDAADADEVVGIAI